MFIVSLHYACALEEVDSILCHSSKRLKRNGPGNRKFTLPWPLEILSLLRGEFLCPTTWLQFERQHMMMRRR